MVLTLVTNKRLLTIGDISVRVYQMVGHKYILRVAAILKAKGSREEGRKGWRQFIVLDEK